MASFGHGDRRQDRHAVPTTAVGGGSIGNVYFIGSDGKILTTAFTESSSPVTAPFILDPQYVFGAGSTVWISAGGTILRHDN